jgi:hypothetical protein
MGMDLSGKGGENSPSGREGHMTSAERTAYPCFPARPSAGELARLYAPTLRELNLAKRTTRGGKAR